MGKTSPYLSRKIYPFCYRCLTYYLNGYIVYLNMTSLSLMGVGITLLFDFNGELTVKRKTNIRWIVKTVVWSVVLTVVFTLASTEILGNVGYVLAFVVLGIFIALGILFDVVGVAVTSADQSPFNSMASHKERGAAEALKLIKNAEKVSSICNDVVGDICGIISGATSAIIVTRLTLDFSVSNLIMQLAVSAAVAGLTIGGKAFGKTFAINESTGIVLGTGRIINIKNRFFDKIKRGGR